jgi:hypothetical protein
MTSFYLFGEKVNQTELDRVNEFMKHHKKCGGKFKIKIDSKSGIGQTIFIKCHKCKKKENITDYTSW